MAARTEAMGEEGLPPAPPRRHLELPPIPRSRAFRPVPSRITAARLVPLEANRGAHYILRAPLQADGPGFVHPPISCAAEPFVRTDPPAFPPPRPGPKRCPAPFHFSGRGARFSVGFEGEVRTAAQSRSPGRRSSPSGGGECPRRRQRPGAARAPNWGWTRCRLSGRALRGTPVPAQNSSWGDRRSAGSVCSHGSPSGRSIAGAGSGHSPNSNILRLESSWSVWAS